MDYIETNKAAWEEAFDHRHANWGEDNHKRLLSETLPFWDSNVITELHKINFIGKSVAQYCCNNGRELLSLMQLGAKNGVGFDIAENIITQATNTAQKAGIENCEFVCCNILEIDEKYENSFDFICFTIGAITWFEDLELLFRKASSCLKADGVLLIHDFHPVFNMLPLPGEDDFDENHLNRVTRSYFSKEPWIENEGMGYMSELYASKTFTSFSHTMSGIINSIGKAQMRTVHLYEYDYDVGLSDVYDNKGFPLSFILIAEKM